MGIFEDILEYRQKMLDKADEQSAEINAKYFPKMGDVVGTAENLGGMSGGMTRAVKKFGPITGKFIDKYGPHLKDTGEMDFPVEKLDILSHFRKSYPSVKKEWAAPQFKNTDANANSYNAQMVDKYKLAAKFLKDKGYLPAGKEGTFKNIGDEFEMPKGMKQESVFSRITPAEGSRTAAKMDEFRVNLPYISDTIVEDYLTSLEKAKEMKNSEWLTENLPSDIKRKLKSDQFLQKGD